MRTSRALSFAAGLLIAVPATAGTLRCSPDSVKVGPLCVDKYEESVWQVPVANLALIKRIEAGKATLAELTAAGATQVGCDFTFGLPPYPDNFPRNGQWTPLPGTNPPTPGVYAVSVPGVLPSSCITWFQAGQACRLSGKRLATNLEWQDAAAGTPDPGEVDDGTTTCATVSANPVPTGSRSACKSSWGAYDMVGNVEEWVAEWADRSSSCTDWTTTGISDGDFSCFGGDASTVAGHLPGAVFRGGFWTDGLGAGVFSVNSYDRPSGYHIVVGFRCVR